MLLSLIAAVMAILAAVFLGLRSQMLKPGMTSWPDAPRCVRYSTFCLSAVLGSYAAAVTLSGYQASSGEVVILTALAVYGGLLWVNLFRQLQRDAETVAPPLETPATLAALRPRPSPSGAQRPR